MKLIKDCCAEYAIDKLAFQPGEIAVVTLKEKTSELRMRVLQQQIEQVLPEGVTAIIVQPVVRIEKRTAEPESC